MRCALCRKEALLCVEPHEAVTREAIVRQHSNRAVVEDLEGQASVQQALSLPPPAVADQAGAWLKRLSVCEPSLKPLYTEVRQASLCDVGQWGGWTTSPTSPC